MRKSLYAALVVIGASPISPPFSALAEQTGDMHRVQDERMIDPAALAAAERIVDVLWPEGAYAQMMQDMMAGTMDSMLAGIVDMQLPEEGGSGATLRESMAQDPHFDERMRISNRIFAEFMGEVMSDIEPDIRRALIDAFARRHTLEHLEDYAAYLQTAAGRAIGSDYMFIYQDPEFIASMTAAMPAIFSRMGELEQRIEEAMSHLPPPPDEGSEPEDGEAEEAL